MIPRIWASGLSCPLGIIRAPEAGLETCLVVIIIQSEVWYLEAQLGDQGFQQHGSDVYMLDVEDGL
jgi:hypothetical protein